MKTTAQDQRWRAFTDSNGKDTGQHAPRAYRGLQR